MHVLFEISLFISWKNIVRSINTTIQNIFFIVENNYEINFAETTDEIFQGNWKRHPNWWKLSLSRGTKPRGKNEYQRAQMESYYTGILLELVIDHNFIPASELSQIPLIRLYLLIPPSPRLVSKFFIRWKLFETNTHIYIYINYYFLKSIYNKFHKHSFFYKDEEKVAILRIHSQNQNHLNPLRKCLVQ